MELRRLRLTDAVLMLEWMHDTSVVRDLQKDFSHQTIEDCERFILAANDMSSSMHLAIVNEDDIYMGTVSLKNISNVSAEFAITVRKSAMGKGYANYAMNEIVRIGFEKLGLKYIYWCVRPENRRAIRFYDKQGYCRISAKELNVKLRVCGPPLEEGHFWYLKENA